MAHVKAMRTRIIIFSKFQFSWEPIYRVATLPTISALFLFVFGFNAVVALDQTTILDGLVTKVRDGDTIEVGGIPIRLNGVSAPEMSEPLGPQSKAFMTDLVIGKQLRCELNGEKTHDRFVGICYLDGKDIGATVIANGLALDCPRYSGGRYAEYEVKGAAAKITLPRYCLIQ
jgi:micrococcal nuclease